jgi:hypothetical protein
LVSTLDKTFFLAHIQWTCRWFLQHCIYFDWNHLFHNGFRCAISSILLGFIKRTLGLGFHIISESENHQFPVLWKKFKKKQKNGWSWFLQKPLIKNRRFSWKKNQLWTGGFMPSYLVLNFFENCDYISKYSLWGMNPKNRRDNL